MSVSLAAAGTPTSATGSATAPAPAFPATVAAGDKAIMFVNAKPFSSTVATPSGWTLVGARNTNGSTTSGTSTGSVVGYVFERNCDGSEGGTTVTLAVTGANTAGAVIHTFTDTLGAWDTTVLAWGNKVGNSVNMSAASTTQTSVAAGDLFVIGFSVNASLGTPSADTLTQTGVAFGTVTNRSDRAITTGQGSRNRVNTVPVTSVTTPSGGATAGYTNSSSTSGTVAFVRLRDVAGGPVQYPAAGQVDATTTASGSTTALLIAAATLAAVTAVTGATTAILPTSGTVAATSTVTGAAGILTAPVQYPAAGTVAATSAVTGSATTRLPSSGTVAGTSATTGTITTLRVAAAGTVAASSTTTGAPTTLLPASGTVAAVSTVTGAASIIGGAQQYPAAGTVTATSTTTGSATARLAASGTAAGTTTATGATRALLKAAGTVSAVSSTTGSSTARYPSLGTVAATTDTTGDTTALLPTAGVVEAVSDVTGSATGGTDLEPQPTPLTRTMFVAAEQRTELIPAEERTIIAVTTARIITIDPETRTLVA